MKPILPACFMLLASIGLAGATVPHEWRERVPAKQRTVANPYQADPETLKAGASIYRERCAECHGSDALGRGTRPSLRTASVHNATDGELLWLLKNGAIRYGMPGWSDLPDQQRWQVERYIKSLPMAAAEPVPPEPR